MDIVVLGGGVNAEIQFGQKIFPRQDQRVKNMMTHKLIGLPSVDIEGVETLEKEYVIINGETYPACNFSERKNYPEDETVFTYE